MVRDPKRDMSGSYMSQAESKAILRAHFNGETSGGTV